MPALLELEDEDAYRAYFTETLCRQVITTHDGIRVNFSPDAFDHAFYENSDRRGSKDVFSLKRAERMSWIAAALANPNALCLQGWDSKTQSHSPKRRVTVVVQDFVIVLMLGTKRNGDLKARFITCFKAENSAVRIRQSPPWTREAYDNAV